MLKKSLIFILITLVAVQSLNLISPATAWASQSAPNAAKTISLPASIWNGLINYTSRMFEPFFSPAPATAVQATVPRHTVAIDSLPSVPEPTTPVIAKTIAQKVTYIVTPSEDSSLTRTEFESRLKTLDSKISALNFNHATTSDELSKEQVIDLIAGSVGHNAGSLGNAIASIQTNGQLTSPTILGNSNVTGILDVAQLTISGTNAIKKIANGNGAWYLAGATPTTTASVTGSEDLFIGPGAGANITSGAGNVLVGESMGRSLTSGSSNAIIGSGGSGSSLTTGGGNVIVGAIAGGSLTTGGNNIISGLFAGRFLKSGSSNIILGSGAGSTFLYSDNSIAIGTGAGSGPLVGSGNVFLGQSAGLVSSNTSTTTNAVAIGPYATVGCSNCIVLGSSAAGGGPVNLGISTSTPYASLSVSGRSGSPLMALYPNSAQIGNILDVYSTSGTLTSVITAGGKWGIGTTSPLFALSVSDPNTNNVAQFTGSGASQCTVVAGTGWSCTSDARLKTDVNPLSNSLDKVLALSGVSYHWKSGDTQTLQVGFIAQDVEKVIPELVRTDENGTKSLLYAQVTPYLVEAIKELNLKMDRLVSTTTPAVEQSSLSAVLSSVGGWVEGGFAHFTDLFADKLHVKTGFEINDQKTGEIYCVSIQYGEWSKLKGDCSAGNVGSASPSVTITNDQSTSTTSATTTLEATASSTLMVPPQMEDPSVSSSSPPATSMATTTI